MKVIKDSSEKRQVNFSTLEPGECFRKFGRLYVKSTIDQQATSLENGDGRVNMCGIMVTPVNAEVHIIN